MKSHKLFSVIFLGLVCGCAGNGKNPARPLSAEVIEGESAQEISLVLRPNLSQLVSMALNPGEKTSFSVRAQDGSVERVSVWYDTTKTALPAVAFEAAGTRGYYVFDHADFRIKLLDRNGNVVGSSESAKPLAVGKAVANFDLLELFSGADLTFIATAFVAFVAFALGAKVLAAVAVFIKAALIIGIFVWALGHLPTVLAVIADLVKQFFDIAGWEISDVESFLARISESFAPIIDAIAEGLK